MDHEVIWTEEATADFDAVITYLTENASSVSVQKFISTFFRKLNLLAGMPYMGVKSQRREGVRRLLITDRYSLVYVVIVDQIYLLRVYDNRSDPVQQSF